MMRFLRLVPMLILLAVTGCSTMPSPVVRHETGEALGEGRVRLAARLETGRMLPIGPTPSAGLEQPTAVYAGQLFGLQAAYGLMSRLDVQMGSFISLKGAGWRIGTKYQIIGTNSAGANDGNLAIAAVVGAGRFAGSGETTFTTRRGDQVVKQRVSTYVFDLGIPVSYRLSKAIAPHSGISFYRVNGSGTAGSVSGSDIATDLAIHLGMMINSGEWEIDVETAFARVHEITTDTSRTIPYFGLSIGKVF